VNSQMSPKAANSKKSTEPSLLARYTCVSILMGIFAIWGKYTFVPENDMKVGDDLHDYRVPLGFTAFYLVSLPLLRELIDRFKHVDMKLLLKESMILYNAGQVALNAWMVYRMLDALILHGHPFVGSLDAATSTGATYAVWVHYCDKYLEFMDTYFMVLRGKMDQARP
jgi:elongation of very long chain fatty acids protein 4